MDRPSLPAASTSRHQLATLLASDAGQSDTDTTFDDASNRFREIGRGGCGVVFQKPGPAAVALKMYIHLQYSADQRYDAARLGRDFVQQHKIQRAWTSWPSEHARLPVFPRPIAFLPSDEPAQFVQQLDSFPMSNEAFWAGQGHSLPKDWSDRAGNDVIWLERIPALGAPVREFLISTYCEDVNLAAKVRATEADRDCMIRLYLGRQSQRRSENQGILPQRPFTLRNFKLHLDQALDGENGLGWTLVEQYARQMARSLAACHWVAGVDANDVEFVIAGVPTLQLPDADRYQAGQDASGARLWMLDCDKVNDITTWNRTGMHKAASNAEYNDPYFPRPCTKGPLSRRLWEAFADEYLTDSNALLQRDAETRSQREGLPEMFIEEWISIRRAKLVKIGGSLPEDL